MHKLKRVWGKKGFWAALAMVIGLTNGNFNAIEIKGQWPEKD